MENKPFVSVIMISYNHENYIKEAIDGVLIQQCNFEVELIIADDCSTDNTENVVKTIIESHPKGNWIKYTHHNKNKGMNLNFFWASQQCKGKYLALCEGDDYWTDPLKLQKQVDFLETNKNYGLTFSNHENYYQQKGKFKVRKEIAEGDCDFTFDDLLLANPIGTLTVLVRNEVLRSISSIINIAIEKNWKMTDLPLWLSVASVSKIRYLNFCSATYRVHDNSASQRNNIVGARNFLTSVYEVQKYFLEKYEPNGNLTKLTEQKYLTGLLSFSALMKDRKEAERIWHKMKSLKLTPHFRHFFYFFAARFTIVNLLDKHLRKSKFK